MNAAVQGRGVDVGQTVGSGLASFLGESFARKIGEMRGAHIAADAQERLGFPTDSGVVDGVNFVEHKLLHGLLGAATGALLDVNDPGRGALSGAFGGVVAETVAEALTLFKTEDTLVHYEDFCHQNDLEPTREGCIQYVNAEMAQFATRMSENANRNADVADVSTALGAMMFNLDVNIAHEVARNAADNNFLFLPFAIMAASALWSAYEIKQAYDEGGVPAALQQLGVELVINAVGGAATNAVFKIGGKAVKNGAELVTALCDHCPVAAGFIRSIGDQIVRHADRLLASNAGQLAAAGADGLLRMDAAAYRGVERIAQNVAQTGGKVAEKALVSVKNLKWGQGIMNQGMPWEDYIAKTLPKDARLPANFKTFDFFDERTGLAISAKTMDTQTASRLSNPTQIYSLLKRHVNSAEKFKEHRLSGAIVRPNMIKVKEIHLGIPVNTNPTQWAQINRAIVYGQEKNVIIKVTEIK